MSDQTPNPSIIPPRTPRPATTMPSSRPAQSTVVVEQNTYFTVTPWTVTIQSRAATPEAAIRELRRQTTVAIAQLEAVIALEALGDPS